MMKQLPAGLIHVLNSIGVRSDLIGSSKKVSPVRTSFPSVNEITNKARAAGFLCLNSSIFNETWVPKRNKKLEEAPPKLHIPRDVLDYFPSFLVAEKESMLSWLQEVLPCYAANMRVAPALDSNEPFQRDLTYSMEGSLRALQKIQSNSLDPENFEELSETVTSSFYHWYSVITASKE
eukprot:gb/GECG01012422.1/.p1 GENE.gb/GECG01012422.1/~~gb/GECG01012422.1/.p1  ORF type:complete len:178 (+),score=17.76 gb/GECG01012422.1/:1-534(+)